MTNRNLKVGKDEKKVMLVHSAVKSNAEILEKGIFQACHSSSLPGIFCHQDYADKFYKKLSKECNLFPAGATILLEVPLYVVKKTEKKKFLEKGA